MAFRVFVSYSTRDINLAQELRVGMAAAGGEVFLAEYSLAPGQSLPAGIIRAIEACDLFLLLWSTNAKDSDWVPQEIGIAKAHGKSIMPVVLHEGIELGGFIKDLKYLQWYRDPKASVAWLREFVAKAKTRKDNKEVATLLGVSAVILFAFAKSE